MKNMKRNEKIKIKNNQNLLGEKFQYRRNLKIKTIDSFYMFSALGMFRNV